MRSRGGPQPPGDRGIERAEDDAGKQRQRQMDDGRKPGEGKADDDGGHAADEELPFRADIEQPGAKTERDAEPRERQRDRRRQRLGNRIDGADRAGE